MTGISVEDIENTLSANNVEPGSMLVRDGYYEYNIRIATLLRTPEDVKNIYIRKGERIMQLERALQSRYCFAKRDGTFRSRRKKGGDAGHYQAER